MARASRFSLQAEYLSVVVASCFTPVLHHKVDHGPEERPRARLACALHRYGVSDAARSIHACSNYLFSLILLVLGCMRLPPVGLRVALDLRFASPSLSHSLCSSSTAPFIVFAGILLFTDHY